MNAIQRIVRLASFKRMYLLNIVMSLKKSKRRELEIELRYQQRINKLKSGRR